jgi:class 3 adenylate cyclase
MVLFCYVAARVQEKALEGEALITERVYSRVKNRINAIDFGEQKLKNINQPVKVFSAMKVIK